MWEHNGQRLATHERGFDNSDQAKRRAALLYRNDDSVGGKPWGFDEITDLHVDVLAQNGERDQPIILQTLRNDDDVEN